MTDFGQGSCQLGFVLVSIRLKDLVRIQNETYMIEKKIHK